MAEKEYIEREAAINCLRKERAEIEIWEDDEKAFNLGVHQGYVFAIHDVETIPAADVRPVVKAEWYGEADGYADGELVYDMWSCPICGKRFEEWEEKPDWNYCPNCGARMEVDTNDS